MPNYYNPYANLYPASYPTMQYPAMPQIWQQSQTPSQPGPACSMCWVSSEMEALGRQMPAGVTQLAMWDSTQPLIYLKSLNQMGMPNQMQKLRYTVENDTQSLPPAQEQNISEAAQPDMSQYVTKKDFEKMKNDLKSMIGQQNSQNGSNQNRGGHP